MKELDDLLKVLCQAPYSQIDSTIIDRIEALIGKSPDVVATEMKSILDDSAYASLASDFGMVAMDAAWKLALKQTTL